MKKISKVLVVIVLCLASLLALVACGTSKPAVPISFKADFNPADWQAEISKVKSENVSLAIDGKSDYIIVYPDMLDLPFQTTEGKNMSISENSRLTLKNSVGFMQQTLSKMIGCEFKQVAKGAFLGGNSIEIAIDSQDTRLINDGYGLKIDTGKITITGATMAGAENGIYTFLEKYLGCMFLAQDYDYIPALSNINLSKIDTFKNPDMAWRMVYGNETRKRGETQPGEVQHYSKLKLNGGDMSDWGTFVHTFFTFVPPEEYFESHPEYFAEYDGIRKYKDGPVAGQLCLTNEDVYQIVSRKLFALMAENPDVRYWDVSQMDTWINRGSGCHCKNCKMLDDAEGGAMGSLLTFINRLADECAEKFPNNYISTLAYNYSKEPPKTLKPRDNVIIKLCFMPGDVTSDLDSPRSSEAKQSKEIIDKWSKISKHLLIWDYNVDFKQYLMPYPIYSAMQNTNNYYLDNNVYGVFHQMDNDKGGNSSELSAYVFAQILWDREVKVEDVVNKYLSVYYGAAAGAMAEYYSALEAEAYKANRALYIYSSVQANAADYLSVKNVNKYLDIFAKAESSVAGDSELLARVKRTKIGVLYVKSQEFTLDSKAKLAALEEFKLLCDTNGITSIYEVSKNGVNEVHAYYNSQLSLINNTPWIVVGALVGAILLIGGLTTLSIFVVKKVKKSKKAKTVQ